MQPLDVTFFGPLKRAYNQECDLYIKTHHLQKITPYEVAGLFNKAYMRVASVEKGVSGFRATGIYPMNPEVFTDTDFISFEDIPVVESETENIHVEPHDTGEPSTSKGSETASVSNLRTKAGNQNPTLSSVLQIVSPMPLQVKEKSKGRQKRHSEVLTATPLKKTFEEKARKKKKKMSKGNENRKKKSGYARNKKVRKVTKNLFQDTSSDSEDIQESLYDESDGTISGNDGEILTKIVVPRDNTANESVCIICEEIGKNNEMRYRCRSCGKWAHKECSGSKPAINFICDFCQIKLKNENNRNN